MAGELHIKGGPLSIKDVETVARSGQRVSIAPAAVASMRASRAIVEAHAADSEPHYGINTGFGSLARQRIAPADLAALQQNLVRSHAAGVGPPLSDDLVRATMLILLASLCRGRSGVRPVVAETLAAMLNAGITPVVPETGSVGASGDLAPLAHIALALIGQGEVCVGTDRTRRAAADALKDAGIKPVLLEAKEGLALINGTHLMAAYGAAVVADAERLVQAALSATAMSIDACRATDEFLDARLHAARGQDGPAAVAGALARLLEGSQILPSHRDNDPRVQDPYSIRCAPAVLGAALDCLGYVKRTVAAELGAVTDNPLVFTEGEPAIVSGGNFHGMPIALPLDALAIAITHIAGISERRTFHMLSAFDAESHLPPFLSPKPGLHSGLMIAQYTAAAACNELATLANPATVHNVPTCAGMEDYNSFGPRAGAKARRAVELATHVVAIELLCAAEALEHHRPLRSGDQVEKAHAAIRKVVPRLTADRPPSPDIEVIAGLIRSGAFEAVLPA